MAKAKTAPVINEDLVKIIARRIAKGELNPLRNVPYSIEHVTNELYRSAVIKELKETYGIEVEV